MRIWLDGDGRIMALNGASESVLAQYKVDTWYYLVIAVDTASRRYSVRINGSDALVNAGYTGGTVSSVERLTFRNWIVRSLLGLLLGRCREQRATP